MLPVIRHIEKSLEPLTHHYNRNGLSQLFDELWPEYLFLLRNFGNLDLYEDEQNIFIEVELPGFKRSDVEVTLKEGILYLQAKRSNGPPDKQANYYIRERLGGQWSREVQLPMAVNEDKVQATFKEGILKITIEKQQKPKPQKIEIK